MKDLFDTIRHLIAALRHIADKGDCDHDLHDIVNRAEIAANSAEANRVQAQKAEDAAQSAATDALNAAELAKVEGR